MVHTELNVWRKAIDLTIDIYQITARFPKSERYSITSQLRRSVVSVPSNIAEGAGRKTDKEFIQFLYIALGSIAEVETQIMIANKLNYINDISMSLRNLTEVRKMISGLINHLKNKHQHS